MKRIIPPILCFLLAVVLFPASGSTSSKPAPYVGVTGFTCRTQVESALQTIPDGSRSHRLMVGVLVTDKTLRGEVNEKPGRTPGKEALGSIFVSDDRVLNFVHYSTENPEALAKELEEVTQLVGPNLDGFQLNILRPPVEQIVTYRSKHPEMLIVFQLQPNLFAEYDHDLTRLIKEELNEYSGMIDYILFDMSLGWGIPLDVQQALTAARELTVAFPHHGIGVAGGLDAEKLYKIEAMAEELPGLSIDAETGMRSGDAQDVLVQENANKYISRAFQIFDSAQGETRKSKD